MPFKDIPEGTTHHEKDNCYKCTKCGGHCQRMLLPVKLCEECSRELMKECAVKANEDQMKVYKESLATIKN